MLSRWEIGEKSGKGFYLYDAKRNATPDPNFNKFLEESRRIANIMHGGKVPKSL